MKTTREDDNFLLLRVCDTAALFDEKAISFYSANNVF